jgi:hypothetical protein
MFMSRLPFGCAQDKMLDMTLCKRLSLFMKGWFSKYILYALFQLMKTCLPQAGALLWVCSTWHSVILFS